MVQVEMVAWALLMVSINYVSAFRCSLLNSLKSADLGSSMQAADNVIGWDSHKAVESISDSLVRTIDGNTGMRKKFEQLCRNAQVIINL